MKEHIDFSRFNELDGVPVVEWTVTSKTGKLRASHYPMRHDDVFYVCDRPKCV